MNVRECAINYLRTLSTQDKERVKKMMGHRVICGFGYAKKNNVDPILFNDELKSLLGGER